MFRKRRRPTPGFGIPSPFNPMQGANANLRQDGTSPFCAMMQVAAEDTYDDYVICRGFDPRILKFIDYADGDADNPGISVAKPFGKRVVGAYKVAEVYPAFLPTQGNNEFSGFKQVTYFPPSPSDVSWRLGQNPGVVSSGGLEGGQPENLSDAIEILYDHNGVVINWLLIDNASIGGGIEGPIVTAAGGNYTMEVSAATPNASRWLGETVDVVDLSGCIFDEPDADLINVWVWAEWKVTLANPDGAWVALNRCCV